ncbi:MAG: polyphosphate polymerase domain-containing protein [Candidatus Absconditabacterales bacterium]
MFKTLKKFDAISLTEMDARMGSIGLDRMENKYIVHTSMLDKILKELQNDYVALEIKDLREFKYHNMYFDTKDYKFFHEHGKGYKLRTKLRTRKYVDSKIAFFEFKQRYYENVRKFKFDIKVSNHGKFSKRCKNFTEQLYKSTYQKKLNGEISPSLTTEYIRFTLCSKKNDERITFDSKVTFTNARNKKTRPYMLSDIILVESKSASETHHAQKVFEKLGIGKMQGVSKYCLGLLCEEAVTTKYKRFEHVLQHIHKIQQNTI